MSNGIWAKIQGNLIQMANFYRLVVQVPEQFRNLPSFGIEITKIQRWQATQGYTHASCSIGWKKNSKERLSTHYFNVQDSSEFKKAEELLQQTREVNQKRLNFDYDNEKYHSGRWKRDLPL